MRRMTARMSGRISIITTVSVTHKKDAVERFRHALALYMYSSGCIRRSSSSSPRWSSITTTTRPSCSRFSNLQLVSTFYSSSNSSRQNPPFHCQHQQRQNVFHLLLNVRRYNHQQLHHQQQRAGSSLKAVAQALLQQELGTFHHETMWLPAKTVLQECSLSFSHHKQQKQHQQQPPPSPQTVRLVLQLWERCLEECFYALDAPSLATDASADAAAAVQSVPQSSYTSTTTVLDKTDALDGPSSGQTINNNVQQHLTWLGNPHFYNPLLRQWSRTIPTNTGLWTAQQLEAKLQRWWSLSLQQQQKHSSDEALSSLFRLDATTLFTVLQGVLKEQQQQQHDHNNPAMAPYIVDAWLQYYEDRCSEQQQQLPHPDAYSYNLVMDAWLNTSNIYRATTTTTTTRARKTTPKNINNHNIDTNNNDHEDTDCNDEKSARIQKRLEALMDRMRAHRIKPTSANYDVLLRFWECQGRPDRMDAILEEQRKRGTAAGPDATNLARTVAAHARQGNLTRAQQLLEQFLLLLDGDPPTQQHPQQQHHNQRALDKAVQSVLRAHRDVLDSKSAGESVKQQALQQAIHLTDYLRENQRLDAVSLERMQGTILDLHIRAGKDEREIQTLIRQQLEQKQQLTSPSENNNNNNSNSSTSTSSHAKDTPSQITFALLMKSYGKHDRAQKATQELMKLSSAENNSGWRPDCSTFATVLNAWAESSQTDAVEQAWSALKLMDEQQRPKIAADVVVFGALMKCIVNSNRSTAGADAEHVLEEMRRRNITPNEIVYNQAIAACYSAHDLSRAERFLMQMEESPHLPSPDLRTYMESLQYFAKRGTVPAAERCEAILRHLHSLASSESNDKQRSSSSTLRPNAYTYSIVIAAWAHVSPAGTGPTELQVPNRMWTLYKQMVDEARIECDAVTYHQLISYLSKSFQQLENVERAEELLKCMEQQRNVNPDALDYFAVMLGWLKAKRVDRAARVLIRRVEAYIHHKLPVGERLSLAIRLVVTSLAESEQLLEATALLHKMQELYVSRQLPEGPDQRAYHAVLNAWRKSNHTQKQKHIAKLESTLWDFKG